MVKRALPVFVLFFSALLLEAEPRAGAWLSVDVPFSREAEAVSLLEAGGMTPISWSNAVVDVSAFSTVEDRPLSGLGQSLTPPDPRWDPWLTGLKPLFRPQSSVARLWVEPARYGEASRLLGPMAVSARAVPMATSRGVGPRQVTGWMILGLALLYGIFRILGEVSSGDFPSKDPRRWVGVGGAALVVLVGLFLVGGGQLPLGGGVGQAAQSEVSWVRHRWFQESWPYGAGWKDWVPGKPWTYPSFERKDGRIVPGKATLPTPDQAWEKAVWDGLAAHHAARIFGPENP